MKWLPRKEEEKAFAWLGKKEAIALVGPRRSGKSTLALRLLEAWKAKGGKGVYVNLEDPTTPPDPDHEYLEKCVENANNGKKALIVLDEVQNASNWGRWVRKQVELERFHLIVTGSSAALLSGEISTILAGRAIQFNILPLSYPDFKAWSHLRLKDYFKIGGYPECVKRPEDAIKLHETYFDLAILKDVAARHKIRETRTLTSFATLLLTESTKKMNLSRAARALKTSEPTLHKYRTALEEAFLVFSVPKYFASYRKTEASAKKTYAWDLGLLSSITKSKSPDYGRKFENAVAIELKRRGYELSYYQGENECDFIAEKKAEKLAIQVCTTDELPERELKGLREAFKKIDCDNAIMVTPSGEAETTSLKDLLEGKTLLLSSPESKLALRKMQ